MNGEGRKSSRIWLFSLVLVLAIFAFQEMLFRYVFPLPEVSNFNRINYSMMVRDEPQGEVQPLSNAAFTWASDPDAAEFVHQLNLYGFRDRDWSLKGEDRVMFVGDSFVEGFMAEDDETIPRGFETASEQDANPIETINLGTGAGGVDDYLAVIADAVPVFQPDTVVLVLYANDFGPNTTSASSFDQGTVPLRTKTHLPRFYTVLVKLARGESVATRWSKKPFLFLPPSDSARSPLHDEEFATHVSEFVSPAILDSMKQGRFNPFVINEYTNYEAFLTRPVDMANVVEHTKHFVESNGSRLMVVHVPYKGQVSDHYLDYVKEYDENKQPASLMSDNYQLHATSLRDACEQFDVPFLDMTGILRQREANGERMYWNYDEHMRATAYLVTGEEIYRFWKNSVSPATEN